MSSSQSNLNSLGYDLVVGLTQNSMNSSMRRLLSTMNDPVEPMCFVYTDDSATQVKYISYADLLVLTNGADPFSISDGTTRDDGSDDEKDAGKVLYDALFAYGFRATMGLPNPKAPDVITLQDKGSVDSGKSDPQRVWYDMYFKDVEIVQQIAGRGDFWTYKHLHQDAMDPWVWRWEVSLNLQSSEFNKLPTAKQNQIRNLDNATMFSVQQLMLDLDEAPVFTVHQPKFNTSFDGDPLFIDFLKLYFLSLRNAGGAVFSQAVVPQNSVPNSAKPSLIPTDLDFIIEPYSPEGGESQLTAKDIEDLATLNYLVMADNRGLPNPIRSVPWNWLNNAEDQNYDGVMSVRKDQFVKYLKSVMDPALNDIAIQPTMDMDADSDLYVHYNWGHETPDDKPTYSIKNDSSDPSHVLTVSYKSDDDRDKDNDGYDFIAGIGDTLIWSQVDSDVYINGNTIKVETTAATYIDVGLGGGIFGMDLSHTRGYAYATKNVTTFTMSANTSGQLHVTMAKSNTDLRQDDDKHDDWYDGDLDASFFAQVATMGDMQKMVNKMVTYYNNHMTDYMTNFDNDIRDLLNNVNAWAFPGDTTFQFSNVKFSDYRDLTTFIKYPDLS